MQQRCCAVDSSKAPETTDKALIPLTRSSAPVLQSKSSLERAALAYVEPVSGFRACQWCQRPSPLLRHHGIPGSAQKRCRFAELPFVWTVSSPQEAGCHDRTDEETIPMTRVVAFVHVTL